MNARDVMSSPVITVSPLTPVRDITQLLLERHISGVPVVEGDEVLGIVSEADLLHLHEAEGVPEAPRGWWRRLVHPGASPLEYVRSHGTRAADIMTHGAITVSEDTPLVQIATVLSARQIHRVPVVRGRQLVGIVTGSDMMQALLALTQPTPEGLRADADIESRLGAELERQDWWNPLWSHLSVDKGIVWFRGMVENEAARNAARVAAEGTPGVCGVIDDRVLAGDWQAMV
ncbi:CBS domain-containing protein [Variovorax sp. J22R133]|uniref:CBS domain-containing protein n=1 Tax=Variovorax brevis TaxID=3053503 RepID=UPI0025768A16|nr:CBS domain-containing protein [Variovorax sp. J22R133]MDM0115997.1 CBS domain-containing protein [Variovorax sp. J22R133]